MTAEYPLTALCQALEVSSSGYYDWEQRKTSPSARALEDRQLQAEITRIHKKSRETYGAPRVQMDLRAQGQCHGRNRIGRLMRQEGIWGRQQKRYRVQTTDSNHDHPIAPNLLAHTPVATRPNQIWVADITYVQTTEHTWVYVAAILDLYSRRIVGWAVSPSINTALVMQALAMALCHRQPPAGLTFHSDRGAQYASGEYRHALEQAKLVPSMSRKGNCYDNATMEAFWSTLKLELIYRCQFRDATQVRHALFDYLETFYNPKRRHSSLGYQTPAEFETLNN